MPASPFPFGALFSVAAQRRLKTARMLVWWVHIHMHVLRARESQTRLTIGCVLCGVAMAAGRHGVASQTALQHGNNTSNALRVPYSGPPSRECLANSTGCGPAMKISQLCYPKMPIVLTRPSCHGFWQPYDLRPDLSSQRSPPQRTPSAPWAWPSPRLPAISRNP